MTSTLSAETSALSTTLDQLTWVQIYWAWILDPKVEWQRPEKADNLPPAISIPTYKADQNDLAVADCKSLYDLTTRTAIPNCQEYRTQLLARSIKDILTEGIHLHWVHSGAQLADSLTKWWNQHSWEKLWGMASTACMTHPKSSRIRPQHAIGSNGFELPLIKCDDIFKFSKFCECEMSTFDQSSKASCLIPHASSRNISRSRHFHLQQIPKTFGSVSPWWSGGREQSWRHCSYWFGLLRSWCGLERPLCSQEPGQALVQLGSCDEPRYSSSWVENRRAQWSLGVGQGSTGVVQQEPLANHNLYIYI